MAKKLVQEQHPPRKAEAFGRLAAAMTGLAGSCPQSEVIPQFFSRVSACLWIIFMTGYCTEEDCQFYHHQPWIRNLHQAGWQGAIYDLWWDSSNSRNRDGV